VTAASIRSSGPRPAGDRVAVIGSGLAAGAVLFGLLAGELVSAGQPAAVAGLAVVVLPVVLWKRPYLAPAALVAAALLIEQFPMGVLPELAGANLPPVAPSPLSDRIPLFHGMNGFYPSDLLLFAVGLLFLLKSGGAVRRWPRSELAAAVAGLVGAVLVGLVVGLAHHGQVQAALIEVRPFLYLALTYLLATMLVTTRRAVRVVLWAVVGAVAFKSLQAIWLFVRVRDMNPRPEAVLAHEEALFFALFIFLLAALWLFDLRGRLRTTATWLLPLVIAGDLANNRRAAWLVLAGGLLALAAVGYRSLPRRRLMLTRVLTCAAVVLAVYLPVFWNNTGGLAQPARALRSTIAPDNRDMLSDLYRIQEDANLKLNIRQAGMLGKGYGVPIDYALPIEDISDIDPFIAFVPHNGIYYVLMRLGLFGGIALWALIGTGIITGAKLARSVDKELAVVGTLVVTALVGYTMQAAVDQGFYYFRVALVMGTLLGLAEAARRLSRVRAPEAAR